MQPITTFVLDLDKLAQNMGGYSYNGEIMMVNNTLLNEKERVESLNAFRFDLLCCVLVTEGELTLGLDKKEYNVKKNSLIFIAPFTIISKTTLSEDGRFFILISKKAFIERLFMHQTQLPLSPSESLSLISSHSIIDLSEEQMIAINKRFKSIYYYLKEDRGRLQEQFISSSFYMLMLELIYLGLKKGGIEKEDEKSKKIGEGRKAGILRNFFALLNEFYMQEHSPIFYANRLFISVQYLSLILKDKTNQNASEWIANFLILKAKMLLKDPSLTIAQIAEQLNFSDQSSFGKFFKKHTGFSPKQYSNTTD